MNGPGWFVRERDVVILCLLAVVSILLAAGSGIAWHNANRGRRVYLARVDTVGTMLDSLNAIQCVPRNPGDAIRVFPAPDTLRRAR